MELLAIHTDREAAVTFLLFVIITFWASSQLIERFQRKRHQKILADGIESEATVIEIGPTGLYVNNAPQLKVQIQVEPKKGSNFVAEIKQAAPLADFNLLHSGSRIIVKYNPTYPKQVVLMRPA